MWNTVFVSCNCVRNNKSIFFRLSHALPIRPNCHCELLCGVLERLSQYFGATHFENLLAEVEGFAVSTCTVQTCSRTKRRLRCTNIRQKVIN